MKIVMVCEFFNEELEYQENLLLKYYGRAGYDVTIITSLYTNLFDYINDTKLDHKTRATEHLAQAKVIRIPFKMNILNRIRVFSSIADILDEESPDLLYFHDIIPNIVEGAAYVRTHPATKMIMDFHGDYSNSGKNWLSLRVLHGVIRRSILRRVRGQLARIFSVTTAGIDFLEDVYGLPREEIEFLPLGTDLELGRAVRAAGSGAALRAELGISPGDFVIFTGGKFNPLKQTEQVIDGFLRLDRADAHLLIVGGPDPAEADYALMLRDRAQDHPRIHFRGWLGRDAIYAHLDAADVAVFPASQSVLWTQAVGMGLPLIVSDRSAAIRGVVDLGFLNLYDNLIVLDHERPLCPQIADHLNELMKDREKLARMSAGARAVGAEVLDYDQIARKTLAVFDACKA